MPESTVVTGFIGRAGEREGRVGVWRKEESAGDVEAWLLRVDVVKKRELERRTWPTNVRSWPWNEVLGERLGDTEVTIDIGGG